MTLRDRALDVAVYAPAGIVAAVVEDLPELASKGRSRIEEMEGRVRSARTLGALTVAFGRQQVERQVAALFSTPGSERPGRVEDAAEHAAPRPAEPGVPAASSAPASPTAAAGTTAPAGTTSGADAAISGYDTLPASQVVRRLDGLRPDELEAVYRHELAGRGRRTILHRVRQIQSGGAEPAPGPDEPDGPAAPA